jgi:uncharacterized membrane protein
MIYENWQKFAAFLLSFVSIAIFWKKHHEFFRFIKSVDDKLFWYNLGWLLFIALLPFTTSLISSYFSDTPAMFLYCLNTFLITLLQNQIWDYVAEKPGFTKEELNLKTNHENKVVCNVAMLNGLLAIVASLLSPIIAFIILLLRFPMIMLAIHRFKYREKN